jgi:hypothetical protein
LASGLEETHYGADGDWLLTDRRGGPGSAGRALLGFERTLLDGVFDGKSLVRLSELGESLVPSLNQMRSQLRRDAVRHGRPPRRGRDKRTPGREQLLHQIRDFRRELRQLASAGDAAAADLAAYAMIFGLARAASVSLPGGDAARTDRHNHEDEIAWSQGDRLTQGWMAVCGRIPTRETRLWKSRSDDLAHAWSEPHGHDAGHGHGHRSGHGESYGGYGGHSDHFGGGHGGIDTRRPTLPVPPMYMHANQFAVARSRSE